jgi:hypothetical protein
MRRNRGRPAAFRLHHLADGRCDLPAEDGELVGVVRGEHERGEPVREAELGQPLAPRGRRAGQSPAAEAAADVEQPADLRGVPAGVGRRLVDDGVGLGDGVEAEVGQRGQPAVGGAADQPEHPRLQRAEPDRDVVRRTGAALGALDPVVAAGHAQQGPLVGVPDAADDLDGVGEGGDRLPGAEPGAAHRLDRVPVGTRAEA